MKYLVVVVGRGLRCRLTSFPLSDGFNVRFLVRELRKKKGFPLRGTRRDDLALIVTFGVIIRLENSLLELLLE